MTTSTLTLTDFLAARIAEDENYARMAGHGCGYVFHEHNAGWVEVDFPVEHNARPYYESLFIKTFSPARVLAECEAKRRIVERYVEAADAHRNIGEIEWAGDTRGAVERASYSATHRAWLLAVAHLALPYADHPDFREEWRP